MYSYNSIPPYDANMYYNQNFDRSSMSAPQDDRFFGGGIIAPLLLGGVAGYAIGNNRPNNYYPQPYIPIQPPIYYNNYYYPYY